MSKKQQAILKNIFELREKIASKVNKPNYFVMSNSKIKEILEKPPTEIKAWKHMKAVHPAVKRNAKQFLEAVTKYDVTVLPAKKIHPRYTPEQKEKTHELTQLAEKIATGFGIKKHLIMNKDQIQDIVLNQRYTSLRDWQKDLIIIEIES